MELKANCKINIGLDILRRRDDGFHDIETVMIPVAGLADTLTLEPLPGSEPRLLQTGIAVDCPPEKNLCMKAFRLLQQEYGIGGAQITLHKQTPFGAGLGGGSSDAAFTLRGLAELFALELEGPALERLAARLGSDTPFFLRNSPTLCCGRGEIMTPYPLPALRGKLLVVVKPETAVSTAEAYAGVTPHRPDTPLAERLRRPLAEWKTCVRNDFEPHIFAAHPELARIKERLYAAGALYASMSGSGSSLFGIFEPDAAIDCDFGCFVHRQSL